MIKTIAIPSKKTETEDLSVSEHFGHCEFYTLITLEDNKITDTKSLPNISHAEGNCLAPVQLLKDNAVNVLIAGGMGMRPLIHFNEMHIDVYHVEDLSSVQKTVNDFINNKLKRFDEKFTCQGR